MIEKRLLAFSYIVLVSASVGLGQTPPLPPLTNGDGNPDNNGMKHAQVGFDGAQLSVYLADPPASPVTMTSGFGATYGSPFDVLEDYFFNSQHGWLPDGILVPPVGTEFWIKRVSAAAPDGATFRVYEGGMGSGMASWSMEEIYANDGDTWKWDRAMQHDVFAADLPGDYSMTFEIYVGDSTNGAPLTQYGSAETTFSFRTPVPEPTTNALLFCMVAIGWWRSSRD